MMHYSRVVVLPAGHHRYLPTTAVFLSELIKLAFSFTLVLYEASKTLAPSTPATVLFEQIWNAVFAGDGWRLIVPAALYTLQNILQYVAVGNLDAVQFQVLYQLKILTTAGFGIFLLNRPLNLTRWLSLILLTIGVCIVSLPCPRSREDDALLSAIPAPFWPFPRSSHELGHGTSPAEPPSAHLTRRSATYQGIDDDLPASSSSSSAAAAAHMDYHLGLTAALAAALVSGLTGVVFEKVLKQSPTQASVWIRNAQLSFYAMLAALLAGVLGQDARDIRQHAFFDGYRPVVWAVVVLHAAGGILTSLVIRDGDNFVKNFATGLSIVLSLLVSIYTFEFKASKLFFIGASLVMIASYLFSLPDHAPKRPPALRLASFEKPTVESLPTPRADTQPGYDYMTRKL
ncbi:UDP-galactose transporter [Escovopsis weberi]|uniref:UDP-galactose transporter n=1 Tax=Escovopsis weberi TaxID=150374 RepID=A0A0N0RU30_ESCWE|nr:UDP-galactose transporter [Escovopsis weberi]